MEPDDALRLARVFAARREPFERRTAACLRLGPKTLYEPSQHFAQSGAMAQSARARVIVESHDGTPVIYAVPKAAAPALAGRVLAANPP